MLTFQYSIGAALAKIKHDGKIEVNVCERTIYNYVRDGILDLEYKELPYGKLDGLHFSRHKR